MEGNAPPAARDGSETLPVMEQSEPFALCMQWATVENRLRLPSWRTRVIAVTSSGRRELRHPARTVRSATRNGTNGPICALFAMAYGRKRTADPVTATGFDLSFDCQFDPADARAGYAHVSERCSFGLNDDNPASTAGKGRNRMVPG